MSEPTIRQVIAEMQTMEWWEREYQRICKAAAKRLGRADAAEDKIAAEVQARSRLTASDAKLLDDLASFLSSIEWTDTASEIEAANYCQALRDLTSADGER